MLISCGLIMGNNKKPNFISFIRKGNLEHTMMEDTSMIFYLEKRFFCENWLWKKEDEYTMSMFYSMEMYHSYYMSNKTQYMKHAINI